MLKKLSSFEELDRNLINEFLRIDLHSTVNGTSGRNSVLRQFITFLEDNNYLADQTIHGVIPAKLAHPRKIITILSDEQISCINEYRKTCTSILKNNAGIERVIDALGHRDSTTVNVYLTYDELHMRKCAHSLKEMFIPMGGATK